MNNNKIFIDIVKGDFIFADWEDGGYKSFKKKIHELRILGYRKVNQEHDSLNYYEYYRRKNHKKIIIVTLMCC